MGKVPYKKSMQINSLTMDQTANTVEAKLLLRIFYDEHFGDYDQAFVTISYNVDQVDNVLLQDASKKVVETLADWLPDFKIP